MAKNIQCTCEGATGIKAMCEVLTVWHSIAESQYESENARKSIENIENEDTVFATADKERTQKSCKCTEKGRGSE